jgi:two-component system LytT family sensor kinase
MGGNIYRWLLKYKVPHLLAWMVVSFALMFLIYNPATPMFPQWASFMIVTGAAFPVCSYTTKTLTPRFLYKHKIGSFVSYIFVLAVLNGALTYLLAGFIFHILSGKPMFRSLSYFVTILFFLVIVDVILIAVSCIIKIISDHYHMEQQMLQIEKEKINTELNFLRSQINPHFLFNVMNTIYFQIEKTNSDARLSIEKFSEMLRYQLYECTTDKISIDKELHYIKNYVAIQSLRMELDSDIRLFIDDGIKDFFIAPLLILPIVENAFKHVSSFKEPGKNKIYLNIKKDGHETLLIEAINTYDQLDGQKHLWQTGGLGIRNLKRRLQLLYPGKHELNINKQETTYQSILKLQYND